TNARLAKIPSPPHRKRPPDRGHPSWPVACCRPNGLCVYSCSSSSRWQASQSSPCCSVMKVSAISPHRSHTMPDPSCVVIVADGCDQGINDCRRGCQAEFVSIAIHIFLPK